jgi:hypothetical protein
MRRSTAAGTIAALVAAGAIVAPGVGASPQAAPAASSQAGPTPRQTCDRPRPTGFRKVKRWGCFAISARIAWQASLASPPGAPCRGGAHFSARWSGSGGTYWIADNITIRRAWNGAPARWALRDIIMVGPAAFDVRLTGEVPMQGTCVPAETLMRGCGSRTIPGYTAGILASIAAPSGEGYFWTPAPYLTQRPPDYSACGGAQLSVQPIWRAVVRYGGAASFVFKRLDLGARLLSTRVGRTLVLRAEDAPDNAVGASEGAWTATISARRVR